MLSPTSIATSTRTDRSLPVENQTLTKPDGNGASTRTTNPENYLRKEGVTQVANDSRFLGDRNISINYADEGQQLGFTYFDSIIGERSDKELYDKFMSDLWAMNPDCEIDKLMCVATEKHDGSNTTIRVDKDGKVRLYQRLTKVRDQNNPIAKLIEKKYVSDIAAIHDWLNRKDIDSVFVRCEMVGLDIQNRQNYGLGQYLIPFAMDIAEQQLPFARFSHIWCEEIKPANMPHVHVLKKGEFRELCQFNVNGVHGASPAMYGKINEIMPPVLTSNIEGVVIQPENELLNVPVFKDKEASDAIQTKKQKGNPLPCFYDGKTNNKRRFCYKLLADWVIKKTGTSSIKGSKIRNHVKEQLAEKLFERIREDRIIEKQGTINNRSELNQKAISIFECVQGTIIDEYPDIEEIMTWRAMANTVGKKLTDLIKDANPQLFQAEVRA